MAEDLEAAKMVEEESSLNTPVDRGEASMETLTQVGQDGVTQDPGIVDARALFMEVKEIKEAVKALASTVNDALVKFKDVNTRIEDLHTAQTGIVANLAVIQKFFPQSDKHCNVKKETRTGSGSRGHVDGNSEPKKRGRKGGKGLGQILGKDIMNIHFDCHVDNEGGEEKGTTSAKSTASAMEQPLECPKPNTSTLKTSSLATTKRPLMNPRFTKTMRGVTSVKGISGSAGSADHDKPCKNPSPPSTKRDSKVRMVDPIGGLSTDCKTSRSTDPLKKKVTSPDPNVVPKAAKTRFMPFEKMSLSLYESQVAAYLFEEGKDPEECLVRMDDLSALRKDFYCCMPGQAISHKIMTLVAKKISLSQSCNITETVCCLPPSFVGNVYKGKSIAELCRLYLKGWMYPFPTLKYIYVPIMNETGHWFTMVIELKDHVVYHFDSHYNAEDITIRNGTMRTLCEVIVQMMGTSEDHESDFFRNMVTFDDWRVKQATGIPNTGTSDNSAVWVLSWLEMEAGFQHNKTGTPDFDLVRMNTILGLLCGDHNELRRSVEEKARLSWDSV